MIQYRMLLLFSEYCRENYEPVGSDRDVDDSVSDVIAILKLQANREESSSDEDDDPNLEEYMESEGYVFQNLVTSDKQPYLIWASSRENLSLGFPTGSY